ncbi:MAG TPA: IS66 family transposase [Solirubrobacteraceae bacterium]
MERAEAEAIYDAGREAVVEVLLAMDRRIQQLEARVEKLERELSKSSRNSSRPPSSDPPGSMARSKDPSGRKRGAQDGHEGHGRPLLPAWAVDEIVEHRPARCGCGHVFRGDDEMVGESARHQVEELPPINVRVIEHRCERLRCPACGKRTRAVLADEFARSCFGPRLEAAVATLSVRNRISRRDAVELCEELFGSRISTGTVDAILTRTSEALSDPHSDLLEQLRSSSAVNMDETGWRRAGERRALWGIFDERHGYLHVAKDRHEDHAKELLADTKAIVTSDRWWAYSHLPLKRRQLCWAHLKRDFAAHAEGLGGEKEFGERGLELCERVFWASEVFKHTADRHALQLTVQQLQREYKPVIRGYATKRARNRHCRGMARNLLKAWPALWTFAKHPGVEPTNNHAERALRSAVIYRKLSFGSQSEGGELRTARMFSAHTTCRLQRRSLFVYLTEALSASARGDPAPLLS